MTSKNNFVIFLLGLLSLLIVLLTPYGFDIDIGPGPDRLLSILWELWALEIFRWFTVLEYFPYYIFRFITIYYVIRYIMSAVSKKKVIIISIISEIIPLIILIPGVLILDPTGEPYINWVFPIPILLLYNLIIIFIFSKRKLSTKLSESI